MTTNKISAASFKNVTMFINAQLYRRDVSRLHEDAKFVSYYGIKNIILRNNNSQRDVKLESNQDVKIISKRLTDIGVLANTPFGKSIRERVKKAVSQNDYKVIQEPVKIFSAAVEQIGNVTRVWIVNSKLEGNSKYGRAYATVICVQATKDEKTGAVAYDTFKEIVSDRNGVGRFFIPSVKNGITMTHHLTDMNKIETRGRPLKVKTKLTDNATPAEVAEVVNETIEVVNETADVMAEVIEVVNANAKIAKDNTDAILEECFGTNQEVSELRDEVAELKAQIALMMLAQRGTEVPSIPAIQH
ncbi:hypothetical protein ACJ7VZ_05385 [Aeromonas salmonicida]|uniref:hypothetical protein n=1 Tax=Aeromonas salmonicida TaxID=645 RepID=UPI0038B6F383